MLPKVYNISKYTKSYIKDLTYKINGAAIEVHKELGPGLLESVYHKCLKRELELRDIKFKSELIIPIDYKGIAIDSELRCDLFVEDVIVVELKSVEKILPIHQSQLLTYMKLLESPQGILINFNCSNIFNEGQKTYVNEIYRTLI
jgi:GxxExxY protein